MDEDSAIVRWFDSGRRELVLLKNVGIAAGEDPGAGVKVGSFVTVNERGDSRGVVLEVRSRKRRRLPDDDETDQESDQEMGVGVLKRPLKKRRGCCEKLYNELKCQVDSLSKAVEEMKQSANVSTLTSDMGELDSIFSDHSSSTPFSVLSIPCTSDHQFSSVPQGPPFRPRANSVPAMHMPFHSPPHVAQQEAASFIPPFQSPPPLGACPSAAPQNVQSTPSPLELPFSFQQQLPQQNFTATCKSLPGPSVLSQNSVSLTPPLPPPPTSALPVATVPNLGGDAQFTPKKTVEQVLAKYQDYINPQKITYVAVKLARNCFFGVPAMAQAHVTPLDATRLSQIKEIIRGLFKEMSPTEYESLWKKCTTSIDRGCRHEGDKVLKKLGLKP